MADPSVIIGFEPDWKEKPEVAYAFQTAVQGTPYFVEQRRPLSLSPTRSVRCRFVFQDQDQQRFLNTLIKGGTVPVCVPIYSEPMFATAITQGASAITALTDLTYLWNIQNCDYAILLDYVTGTSEMIKVASVAGQVISLSAPIVKSWTAAQTVIYPAISSVIKEVKESPITARFGSMEVEFQEIEQSAVATKVWVGLDEQVCSELPPSMDFYCTGISGGTFLDGLFNLGGAILLAGFDGVIKRSEDFGLTWSSVYTAPRARIRRIARVTDMILLAVNTPSVSAGLTILRSTDNGVNWGVVYTNNERVGFDIIHFGNGICWCAGSGGYTSLQPFVSSDYGATWGFGTAIPNLSSLNCLCKETGGAWIAGANYNASDPGLCLIIRSIDSGSTWTRVNQFNSDSLPWLTSNIRRIFDLGAGTILAVGGAKNRIFRSTNYGVSWSLVLSDASYYGEWFDVAYTLGTVVAVGGAAVGSSLQIKYSRDSGATWEDGLVADRSLTCSDIQINSICNGESGVLVGGTYNHAKLISNRIS